jgi:hypothetical protein
MSKLDALELADIIQHAPSAIYLRYAADELRRLHTIAAQSPAPAAPAPTIRDVLKPFDDPATGALFAEACDLGGAAPAPLRMLTEDEIRQAVTDEGLSFTAPDTRVARGVQIAFAAANNLPLSASPEDTP